MKAPTRLGLITVAAAVVIGVALVAILLVRSDPDTPTAPGTDAADALGIALTHAHAGRSFAALAQGFGLLALGRLVTGDAQPYQYLVESIRKFPSPGRFAGMIEAAGFRHVSHRPLTGGIRNDDHETFGNHTTFGADAALRDQLGAAFAKIAAHLENTTDPIHHRRT